MYKFDYNQLMSASLNLYRLQQRDSQIDQNKARLEAIRDALENDQEVQQAMTEVTKAEAEERQTGQELSQIESEVQALKLKIERSEANLYSGSVHNPKELQDLQNEVAALKRHLATLEDRQLEAMLTKEAAEALHQQALAKLQDVQAQRSDQNSILTNEQTSLNKDIERLDVERQAAVSALDDQTLAHYEELRQERRGVAVAAVSENACSACGTTLTPAQQQAARSSTQIAHCPTCGRILYAA